MGAPTIPLKPTGAAPKSSFPVGSATKPLSSPTTAGTPTIKLATSNAPIGAPTIALKTTNAPLSGMATPTAPGALPKATVSLNPPTKPLSPIGAATKPLSPVGAATKPLSPSAGLAATLKSPSLSTMSGEVDESGASTFTKILSGLGLVAAIVVISLQLKMSNVWINASDSDTPDDWMQILETP
jgi:hypothetical protein